MASGKIYGNISGLKPSELKRLERLYRRRVPPAYLISPELAKEIASISQGIRRQVGLLIDRRGEVVYVIVGDTHQIVIPSLSRYRVADGRLRGLRCIHTHLGKMPLNQDDLTDLALLRLDMMAAITVNKEGLPETVYAAHLLPQNDGGRNYLELAPVHPAHLRPDFLDLVASLEEELARRRPAKEVLKADRAILISVSTKPRPLVEESLSELKELARTAGVVVLDTVIQRRDRMNPKFLMGRGKLSDLVVRAMQLSANLLIFDQELTPSQMRSITDFTELRVIDRTQLILDIFAQRARSREGKLQVEMAQLRYMLPRLSTRDDALSRLTGGIGGRGPGETKLEVDRRRVRERLARLERELKGVRSERSLRRRRRQRRKIPVVSIVGYTNAGKTTLLNTLTKSQLLAEDRLFATLDPTSRRLYLPALGGPIILTDTVGFIRELPAELRRAFQATLEELHEADLLIHLIDISYEDFEERIEVVDALLEEMGLSEVPQLRVFNKVDLVDTAYARAMTRRYHALAVSAIDSETVSPLLEAIAQRLKDKFISVTFKEAEVHTSMS
ncbi:GTPase HflX [Thermosulfuriphilus ammonigenes]|uniref:GTPase HflX n=1 Tax=Thermosulfuriphilus ammonigenes TaxID=1936021 RepID=A0A6G7PXW3_9BACT|nr:GTPase HflX [Thermosulfuriphilus ammonigenes]MBA2849610.1 GTP-binding protein HflX [Thermosulfuriphilus ammonigenes]QIJ72288.1 GTPase HflX [Thermosulfuriphilus ammonigenes]HFB83281.1 GTPase HflX [Thermodesulfatator sp.]